MQNSSSSFLGVSSRSGGEGGRPVKLGGGGGRGEKEGLSRSHAKGVHSRHKKFCGREVSLITTEAVYLVVWGVGIVFPKKTKYC